MCRCVPSDDPIRARLKHEPHTKIVGDSRPDSGQAALNVRRLQKAPRADLGARIYCSSAPVQTPYATAAKDERRKTFLLRFPASPNRNAKFSSAFHSEKLISEIKVPGSRRDGKFSGLHIPEDGPAGTHLFVRVVTHRGSALMLRPRSGADGFLSAPQHEWSGSVNALLDRQLLFRDPQVGSILLNGVRRFFRRFLSFLLAP